MSKKISELTATATANPTDLLAIVQGGVTKQVPVSGLPVPANPTFNTVTSPVINGRLTVLGKVGIDGQILEGTGFTVVPNPDGTYSINFTSQFTNFPTVFIMPTSDRAITGRVLSHTLNSVTVIMISLTGALTTCSFDFMAVGTV